ncbi:MAG: 4-(cytidine 5'-diphospho)-2-C-methyl-D-erythritol kinase [Rhodobiaceae bacterium]|nr:4-(cytidine 5'-diphospho)-2-C-methyl-D-erythritol kinase [Rhodobiaceae bacterium]
MTLDGLARAKINLTLHLTGRRADGYHLLDSVVAFADVGDRLTVAPGESLSLTVTGPQAGGVPTDGRNLVLKAATKLAEAAGIDRPGARISLEKHLPAEAGIGGGSADAALALVLLDRMWGTRADLAAIAPTLGADVPMCLAGKPARVRGVGEVLSPVSPLPPLHVVLANPGVSVSTVSVFAACRLPDGPPPPEPDWTDEAGFLAFLGEARNDLEDAAMTIAPAIAPLLSALREDANCLFARMTGSGATCFGLFRDPAPAQAAADAVRNAGLARWSVAARLETD